MSETIDPKSETLTILSKTRAALEKQSETLPTRFNRLVPLHWPQKIRLLIDLLSISITNNNIALISTIVARRSIFLYLRKSEKCLIVSKLKLPNIQQEAVGHIANMSV